MSRIILNMDLTEFLAVLEDIKNAECSRESSEDSVELSSRFYQVRMVAKDEIY